MSPESYRGELEMLRGLVGLVRVIAKQGDMDELRRAVAHFDADEEAARKTTAETIRTRGPRTSAADRERRQLLLADIRRQRGHWTTSRTLAAYRRLGIERVTRTVARQDLQALHRNGHLVRHDDKHDLFYTYCTKGSAA